MTPTLTQIQSWECDRLVTSASLWESSAKAWGDVFAWAWRHIDDPSDDPDGKPWRGNAADSALQRAAADHSIVAAAVLKLTQAATAARDGAEYLFAAKEAALKAIQEAANLGFALDETLTLYDTKLETGFLDGLTGGLLARGKRAALLAAHSTKVTATAKALLEADLEVARQIKGAISEFSEVLFGPGHGAANPGSPDNSAGLPDWLRSLKGAVFGYSGMSSGDVAGIDQGNRTQLDQLAEEYDKLPDGQVKTDRLADIAAIRDALKVPDSHLISLERPEDPSKMIAAAIAVGDPFNADHVSVTVPGMRSTPREGIAGMTGEAEQLRNEAVKIAREVGDSQNIATIAWMGYQPPAKAVSWETTTDDIAQEAAPKLTSFLEELEGASHKGDHTLALFGHSYGSLVSGIALRDGASAMVDNAVVYGSPGFGATSTGQLGMTDESFFVMTADGDKVSYIGNIATLHGWGSDPDETIGGSDTASRYRFPVPETDTGTRYRFPHLETDEGSTPLPSHENKTAAHGHSEYSRDAGERMTGYNLATILLNRPDLAVEKTPDQ